MSFSGCKMINHHNSSILSGTWVPVKQQMGGLELPSSVFENQTLTLNDNKYIVVAELIDKGEVVINDGKMDIYGKDGPNAGKHFTAIYKFESNQLTICYNLNGDKYPEGFETKNNPVYFLAVYKKR